MISTLYIKAIIGVAVVATVGLAYWHYTSLVEENKELSIEVAAHKGLIAAQDLQIKNLKRSIEISEKAIEEASNKIVKERKKVQNLRDLFDNHDLAKLMRAKPGLMTKKMQKGTKDILQQLHEASK